MSPETGVIFLTIACLILAGGWGITAQLWIQERADWELQRIAALEARAKAQEALRAMSGRNDANYDWRASRKIDAKDGDA